MQKILIVDDNPSITKILKNYITLANYECFIAQDGNEAISLFEKIKPDLVLLDINMPYLDGFEVCKIIRTVSQIPIIMISARHEDYDKIMSLEYGADDYIIKPFSPNVVVAKIKALLRRVDYTKEKQSIITLDNLKIDIKGYQVSIDDKIIALTKKEIEILFTLASNPSLAYSRGQLLDLIWGYDYEGDDRCIDTHIRRLRHKLSLNSNFKAKIKTVWGVGYQFEK